MPETWLLDRLSWLIQLVQADGTVQPFRLLLQLAQIVIPLAIAVPPVITTVSPSNRFRSPVLVSWSTVVVMVGLLCVECWRLCAMGVLPPALFLFLAITFLVIVSLFPFVAHAYVQYLDIRLEDDRIRELREDSQDAVRWELSAFLRGQAGDLPGKNQAGRRDPQS